MKHLFPLLALPLTLGFAACESMPKSHDAPAMAAEEGDDGDDDAAEAVAKAERALENSRLELKIAQAETEASARKAREEVVSAEDEAKLAADDLAQFLKNEREVALAKLQLDLDRGGWRLEAEKQELAELEAMYKKDDVATLTKELVLQRGQKGVEFAERDLANDMREASMKREFELPKKQHELEVAKRDKDNDLREARADEAKTKDEIDLKMRKARAEISDAEKALNKARTKAAKAVKP